MKKIARKVSFLLAVLFIGSLAGCGYNVMQAKEETVKAAWGDVESTYQRRADLIPNLVEVVRGYAKHENETLVGVTEARAKIRQIQLSNDITADANAMQKFQEAQSGLSSALSRLMVVVEKYPDLKANENFRSLQDQLEGTENRINVARVRYNKSVETFNTSIRIFPNSVTNSFLLHLRIRQPFMAEEGAKAAPKVKFD